jgi:hypothetical protein
MRIAIHPHHEHPHSHLPHQGLWFVLMFTLMMMLFGTMVAGDISLLG